MVEAAFTDNSFVVGVRGHWLDSLGHSIVVSPCPGAASSVADGADGGSDGDVDAEGGEGAASQELVAVLTPIIDHPDARDRALAIRHVSSGERQGWRCGGASLEVFDEELQRCVWLAEDGRRSVWSRTCAPSCDLAEGGAAFPWLLNDESALEPWLPLDIPRAILYDGARVAALLDIRQMIGSRAEPQERLTHILMDYDLHSAGGDYLIPGADSVLWQTLDISDALRRSIIQRIHRVKHEALSQRVSMCGESEVLVGHHKLVCRPRDVETLSSRWTLSPNDERKPLEIARLLALYSIFDNPLHNRRNGVHLGLDPEFRRKCDYELFASPMNAVVPNGRFASKWPHVEWRFGSIGSYPSVLRFLPANAILCVNPPFTEAYLTDVMARLEELKLRFRLRISVPIQEMPWRSQLCSALPSAEFLYTYYDASSETHMDLLHPTLFWEDPRCHADVAWEESSQQLSEKGQDAGPFFSDVCSTPAATAAAHVSACVLDFSASPLTTTSTTAAAAAAAPAPGPGPAPVGAPGVGEALGEPRGRARASPGQQRRQRRAAAAAAAAAAVAATSGEGGTVDGGANDSASLDTEEWPDLLQAKDASKKCRARR